MNQPLDPSLQEPVSSVLHDRMRQRLNLRQLGGLPAADGRTVKADKLFRSGELADLNAEELQLLESLGLAFICDFRTEDKGREVPTPAVLGAAYLQLPVAGANFGPKDIPRLIQALGAGENVVDPLPAVYRQFVTDESTRSVYTQLMRTLIEAEGRPAFWHCTAGKDRTGFAAAVILLALGADEETIIADYMLTAEYRLEASERILGQVSAVFTDERALGFVRGVLGVRPEYIAGALDEMRRVYGSTEAYLEQGLGVSREDREQLRHWYLD